MRVCMSVNRTSLRISWDTAASCKASSAPGAKAARRSAALETDKETYNIELAEDTGEYVLVREGLAENHCFLPKLRPGSRSLTRLLSLALSLAPTPPHPLPFHPACARFHVVCVGLIHRDRPRPHITNCDLCCRYLVRVTGHSHKRGANLWSRAAEGNFRTQAAGVGTMEMYLRYCVMLLFLSVLFYLVLGPQQ